MDTLGRELVFIVGHYKSGSSWLAYLLSLHPSIRGVSETHIFRHSQDGDLEACINELLTRVAWAGGGRGNLLRHRLAGLVRPLRRHGQATLHWRDRPTTLLDLSLRDQHRLRQLLRANLHNVDDFRRSFFAFLHDALEPPAYLVEKTPTNIFYVPEIRRLFPRSKIVAIYRDGRDVVISDKFHRRNEYRETQVFKESVSRWRSAMDAHLEFAEAYDIFSLSYENLLEDGRSRTKGLLEFLELDDEPSIIEDMLERSSFQFITGRKSGMEVERSFFRKGVAGDWINHFSSADCDLFGEIAGETLVALGYEKSPDPWMWHGRADAGRSRREGERVSAESSD